MEVAAGAVSNPVGLHGLDPVPLWQLRQGVQEGLGERNTSYIFFFYHIDAKYILKMLNHIVMLDEDTVYVCGTPTGFMSQISTSSTFPLYPERLFQSSANLLAQYHSLPRLTLCSQRGILEILTSTRPTFAFIAKQIAHDSTTVS